MIRPIAYAAALGLPLSTASGVAEAACWTPIPEQSRLAFEVVQADAPLDGRFESYDACICLDPHNPSDGSVRVSVATASVDTQLTELDRELVGPDFFHSGKWATAVFHSDRLTALDDNRFLAQGTLTIRDSSRPLSVPFEFRVAGDGNSATAKGETHINRLDYGIGQGEWSDTRWVGDQVRIHFEVTLRPRGNQSEAP